MGWIARERGTPSHIHTLLDCRPEFLEWGMAGRTSRTDPTFWYDLSEVVCSWARLSEKRVWLRLS
jgi:hypothetical protein